MLAIRNGIPVLPETLKPWFQMLIHSFEDCDTLELSFRPDLPRDEMKYRYLESQVFETSFGYTLIVTLENVKTGEHVTTTYPDIVHISKNDMSNEYHTKIYIDCLDRSAFYELLELQRMKDRGVSLADEQAEKMAYEKYTRGYRIIFYPRA